MGKLDWIQVLVDNSIPFKEDSSHTARNEVSVCCPFCDFDDKYFMGINLDSGAYGCWYSAAHRGFSPVRLLAALLRVSPRAAKDILSAYSGVDLSEFSELTEDTFSVSFSDELEVAVDTCFCKSMQPLTTSRARDRRFVRYLVSRGFRRSDIGKLSSLYGIQTATTGLWSDRLILPVYDTEGLATWTGRAIGDTTLRYMTLSHKIEMEDAIARKNIKDLLFLDSEFEQGGEVLVITEGPFDAMKLDMYGRDKRVRCACLFGKTVSEYQLETLKAISSNFKKIVFVLDEGTGLADVGLSLSLQQSSRVSVPFGKDDLGDLSWDEAAMFSRRLLRKFSVH